MASPVSFYDFSKTQKILVKIKSKIVIRIDKYPDGFVTLNGNIFPCTKVYSSEIHLTPSEQNYRYIDLDIFGKEAFIYTLRPSSFKICDIDGNFIKNISEDCITKKTRDYISARRSDDLISVDNMYNYISLKINNEDSVLGRCIIEFDIYA